MKLRTLKRMGAMFFVNHIFAGARCFGIKRKLLRFAGYEIGEGTKVVGPLFITGKLRVGRDCWIGRNFSLEGNGTVAIGDRCDVAPGVTFLTGGHQIGGADRRAGPGETYEIRVGAGTWIGAHAVLGRSITVGKSAVIAACACVMSDVSENTLVGGVPAKRIREIQDECKENSQQ